MSKKKTPTTAAASTIRYLKVAEVHDDTMILKDGTLRGVLEVSSINFNLKSEDEQNAIIYSYQSFLNSLEFPIQIYIRSKKLDLDDYIAKLGKLANEQTNSLLKSQTQEYADFINKLIEYADIMEKQFYVIIPYESLTNSVRKNVFELFMETIHPDDSITKYKSRRKAFADMKKGLSQRISIIQSGLENCGLETRELNTKEIIELLYSVYNPITSMNQKLTELNTNLSQTKK